MKNILIKFIIVINNILSNYNSNRKIYVAMQINYLTLWRFKIKFKFCFIILRNYILNINEFLVFYTITNKNLVIVF